MPAALFDLATRHGRVVTAAQLDGAGFGSNDLRRLRRDGLLVRLFHGTYAVPPVGAEPFELACRGALRYAGRDSVVVGESALALRSPYPAPLAPEVAVPRARDVRSTTGLTVRRVVDAWLAHAGESRGLPVQDAPTATVWGWSRVRPGWDREAVVCAAVVNGATTVRDIGSALRRLPRVPAAAELRETLRHVGAGCESPAEIAYLVEVERRFGLPCGERQAVVEVPGRRVRRVDVRYGRVVVEVDGAHHAERRDDDAVRDVVLAALGLHVLRVRAADIRHAPAAVAAMVADAIASSS